MKEHRVSRSILFPTAAPKQGAHAALLEYRHARRCISFPHLWTKVLLTESIAGRQARLRRLAATPGCQRTSIYIYLQLSLSPL